MRLTQIIETLQITNHTINYNPQSKEAGNLDSVITRPGIHKPDMMEFNIEKNQQYFSYEETIEIAENEEKFQKYIPIYTTCRVDDSFLGTHTQDILDAFKNGKSDTATFDQTYDQYLNDTASSLMNSLSDIKLSDRPAIIIVPVPSKKSLNVNLAERLQQMIATKNKNTQVFNNYRKRKVPSFNVINRGTGKYDSKMKILTGEVQNKREIVYDQALFSKLRTQKIDLDVAEQMAEQRKQKIQKTLNILTNSKKFTTISKQTIITILQDELNYLNSEQFETDLLTNSDKNTARKTSANKEYTQNSGYGNEVKMLRDDFFEALDDFNADIIHNFVKSKNPKKFAKKPLIIIVDDIVITRKTLSQMYKHLVLNDNMSTDRYDAIVCAWAKKHHILK